MHWCMRVSVLSLMLCTVSVLAGEKPHCHDAYVLKHQPKTPEEIDFYISAELPDEEADPKYFQQVTHEVVHGCAHWSSRPACR